MFSTLDNTTGFKLGLAACQVLVPSEEALQPL